MSEVVLPIDYSLPFANVQGTPLWMLPSPLSPLDCKALESLHARGRAATHLADYAALAVLDQSSSPALHHRSICECIDDLLDDRFDDLIINTPPGSAKSTYTSHALGSYFMGRYPSRSIILATHTADLSEKWSRKVRNTIASNEHRLIFPDPGCQLSRDSTAVGRWATAAGGEFLAAGVGASILGFRADLAVIDDPISGFEQAQSITQLQKIHSWFETDLITRLKPRGKIVQICQRLSPNDLAGYMIARHAANPTRRLRLLVIRMEAEEGDEDGTHRSPGERLWPEWFTQRMVEDARRDEFKWRTLYQQRPPSEEGSWVSPDDIRFRPSPPSSAPLICYGMSDIALSVNSGDYTVHAVVAIGAHPDGTSEDWDILHVERARVDPDTSASALIDLCHRYRPQEWLIDDDNASKVFGPLVATTARQRGVAVPWHTMPMRGQDKETRAAGLRGMFKRRRVFMPSDAPFTNWLTKELLTFPNAVGQGVDDGVDALGLLGRRLLAIASPAPVTVARSLPTVQDMTLNDLFEDNEVGQLLTTRRI